jgi:hypothetical protein
LPPSNLSASISSRTRWPGGSGDRNAIRIVLRLDPVRRASALIETSFQRRRSEARFVAAALPERSLARSSTR